MYRRSEDVHVSGSILSTGSWEKNISKIIKMLLNKYVHKSTVFLDIGANLGIHSLYAAKLGFKVWAVEPQQSNLLKVNFENINIVSIISI